MVGYMGCAGQPFEDSYRLLVPQINQRNGRLVNIFVSTTVFDYENIKECHCSWSPTVVVSSQPYMALQMHYGMILLVQLSYCICLMCSYREAFSPDLSVMVLPAHLFVKSIHNTTIKRGWLRMRLQWGDNVIVFWEAGHEIYDPTDPHQ
jgi:hypothetical protein